MLSKYDHVRGFNLSNRYVTQECFQPPNILSVPPNRQPSNKICQPPSKKNYRAQQESILFWGSIQNSIHLYTNSISITILWLILTNNRCKPLHSRTVPT